VNIRLAAITAAIAVLSTTALATAQDVQSFTDATGRTVQIEGVPSRIAALHDIGVAVPMIELGLMPMTSSGRNGPESTRYMRGAQTLTGVDFKNSDIIDIGGWPADIEKVASADPDLIVLMETDPTDIAQLEAIAPTFVVSDDMRGEFTTFEHLAAITGTTAQLEQLKTRYAGQIAQLQAITDPENVKVAVIGTQDGQLVAWHTYGAIGKVLRDAGFQSPDIINAIEGSDRVFFSGEEIQSFDADFIITTYDVRAGETPETIRANFDAVSPGYCDFLEACRNGQFIMLPREDAVTRSYTALGLMAATVGAIVGGKEFVSLAD